jgi:hypothetical protein
MNNEPWKINACWLGGGITALAIAAVDLIAGIHATAVGHATLPGLFGLLIEETVLIEVGIVLLAFGSGRWPRKREKAR